MDEWRSGEDSALGLLSKRSVGGLDRNSVKHQRDRELERKKRGKYTGT